MDTPFPVFALRGLNVSRNIIHARVLQAGLYKFPYDMQPTYRPQWSGSRVLSQLRSYVSDRRAVLDRRDRRDGLEIRNTYASPKYPEYYLQNFHYQTVLFSFTIQAMPSHPSPLCADLAWTFRTAG